MASDHALDFFEDAQRVEAFCSPAVEAEDAANGPFLRLLISHARNSLNCRFRLIGLSQQNTGESVPQPSLRSFVFYPTFEDHFQPFPQPLRPQLCLLISGWSRICTGFMPVQRLLACYSQRPVATLPGSASRIAGTLREMAAKSKRMAAKDKTSRLANPA